MDFVHLSIMSAETNCVTILKKNEKKLRGLTKKVSIVSERGICMQTHICIHENDILFH